MIFRSFSSGKTNSVGILGMISKLFSSGTTPALGASGAGSSFLAAEGAALMLQHGGWINEPIEGIGRSGKRYTFGEAGPELVTPKSKLEGGSERERQSITIINVVDSRQLDQYLASSAGQNAVLNVIGSRAGEVRRIIS